jgi:hypothetical protein
MNAPAAHFLRGRLTDVEPVAREREQGPIPAHLRPAPPASRPVAVPSPGKLPDRPLGAFPGPKAPSVAVTVPEPQPEPSTLAPCPVETPADRLKRLRREFEARQAEGSRLSRKEVDRLRAARRAAGDSTSEKRGPKPVIPRPPCPAGCQASPKSRGKRRGKHRWHCADCGTNWQTT